MVLFRERAGAKLSYHAQCGSVERFPTIDGTVRVEGQVRVEVTRSEWAAVGL